MQIRSASCIFNLSSFAREFLRPYISDISRITNSFVLKTDREVCFNKWTIYTGGTNSLWHFKIFIIQQNFQSSFSILMQSAHKKKWLISSEKKIDVTDKFIFRVMPCNLISTKAYSMTDSFSNGETQRTSAQTILCNSIRFTQRNNQLMWKPERKSRAV